MKKAISILALAAAVAISYSCSNDETTCTLRVYKQYNGGKYELIQHSTYKAEEQYKNYVKSFKDKDGNITNIKTIVTCE